MQDLTVFNNPEFGDIRTTSINGEPYFVGKDVATVLGYSNPRKAIADHVDTEDKTDGVTIRDSLGRDQNPTCINESGLYSLILSSKMPKAKAFKRWVTAEVLPSIRKHGIYGTQETIDKMIASPEWGIQLLQALRDEQKKTRQLQAQNSELVVDNQIMAPKAKYFDELVDRNLLTSFRETAKQLNVKETVFVGFLLEHKYIYRDKKGKLMPYAQYAESGLFQIKECFNEKTQWSGTQTMVTPKGKETFRLLCIGAPKS